MIESLWDSIQVACTVVPAEWDGVWVQACFFRGLSLAVTVGRTFIVEWNWTLFLNEFN